jgi:DNA (cytosine-5)-methyltransferase 1
VGAADLVRHPRKRHAAGRGSAGDDDERHICPLQLGTIERCIRLWSNPGELVLSPFTGIGSEGYEAVRCTHHSTARGGRPINDQSRATAWHILKWAQELYIDNILIENVPEFRQWGPLGANGRPLKSKKGQTYRAFLDALRSFGYRVEDRVVNAADYGDPTTRQRLFILAQRGQKRVAYPVATHSRTGGPTLFGKTRKWRAAREVIDWSVAGRSIFNRKKPLAPATMARILAGLEKFGGPELKPFLVVLRQHMAGRSVDVPLPTLSAQGRHIGLCEPFLVDAAHGDDAKSGSPASRTKSLNDPLGTVTGSNRFAIAEPFIVANNANNAPKSVDEPVPTVTGGNRNYLVESFVLSQQSGGSPRSTRQPLPTVATDGAISLVEPFLVPYYTERPEERHARTRSVDDPLPTIPATGGGKFGVVEPFIISAGGAPLRQPRSTDDPMPTVMGSDRLALAEPFLVQTSHGQRVHGVERPLPTVTTARGGDFAVVEPFITKYNGTAKSAQSVGEPLDTVTSKDRFGLVQPCINGYVLDIRFRMLQPHELAAAMSFPKDYQFTGIQEDIVKQIGNAWPGETAKAFCLEILAPYAARRRRRDVLPAERTA